MKKFIAIVALVVTAQLAYAQKAEVVSAFNYMKFEEYDKAKESIDKASVTESTKGLPKTWYYKGLIYQAIAKSDKFKTLDANALTVAFESFAKSLEIEPKGDYSEDINARLKGMGNEFFNKGASEYNTKKYADAIASFDKALKINTFLKVAKTDSLNMLCLLYSAYSAERINNIAKAKENYGQLMDINYNDARIYMALGVLYKAEKDTMKALNIIQTGRKLFPNDNSLIIEELNYYLSTGKNNEAIDRLNLAISKEPKNHTLYFALGTIYDKTQAYDKARESYLKAIEVKADYFDAYYNLGAMIFNQGAEMANSAANLKTDAEYNKAKVKFDERFKESLPYLEKAHELNKKDQGTLVSLKQLYIRMNMTEKYNQIKAELDNLK